MPDKPSLLLIGCGGHARSCIDVIELEDRFDIRGLIGQESEVGTKVLGYPVLGSDSYIDEISTSVEYALITVGHIRNAQTRLRLINRVKSAGIRLATIVSPLAYVSRTASLGAGTIVMHHALINANVVIGNNCIINSKCLIEHDVKIGDCCHISTGATLNGGVNIKKRTFVGSMAVIREGVIIDSDTFVGMGNKVNENLSRETSL